jgi:hypothetical protein
MPRSFNVARCDIEARLREGSRDNLWLRVTPRILEPDGEPVFDRFDIECR